MPSGHRPPRNRSDHQSGVHRHPRGTCIRCPDRIRFSGRFLGHILRPDSVQDFRGKKPIPNCWRPRLSNTPFGTKIQPRKQARPRALCVTLLWGPRGAQKTNRGRAPKSVATGARPVIPAIGRAGNGGPRACCDWSVKVDKVPERMRCHLAQHELVY